MDAIKSDAPDEFLGVNDQLQLAKAASMMRDRIVKSLMLNNGMHCMDPRSVWIGPKVKVGRDVTIHPSVQLWGDTVVEDGAFIGSFTVLKNSTVRANANLKGSVRLNDSTVGERASAGPFAFMREHAELLVNAHVGRFVEQRFEGTAPLIYRRRRDRREHEHRRWHDHLQLRRRKEKYD